MSCRQAGRGERGCGDAGTEQVDTVPRPRDILEAIYARHPPCPPLSPPRLPTSTVSHLHLLPDVTMPTRTRISRTDGLKTRRPANSNTTTFSSPGNGSVLTTSQKMTGKGKGKAGSGEVSKAVALSMVDYTLVLSLVLGGCCSSVHVVSTATYPIRVEFFVYRNVWSYEQLLKMDAHVGEGNCLTY